VSQARKSPVDPSVAAALAVGVVAAVLRLWRLDDPFWQDEVASARILREPTVPRMLAHVVRTESTPPLWYALGWSVHQLGVPLQDVRVLSVLSAGVLAGLVVLVARSVLPLAPAVLAGVLVTVGGEFALAGRELRAYALLALLSVAFAVTLDSAVRRPRRRATVALVSVTAAGALTHYFFLFTIAAGLIWIWLEPEAKRARRAVTLSLTAGLLLASPWLPFALRQYRHNRYSWIGSFDARVVANTSFRLFTPLVHEQWVPLAFLALVLVGAVQLARTSSRGRLCAALAVGPLATAATLWGVGVRVYAVRNLIEIGAFVAICVGAALTALAPRVRAIAVVALGTAAVAGFVWDQQAPAAPYNRIAQALVAEGWSAGAPVMVFGSPYAFRSPLEWYLPRGPRLGVLAVSRSTCRVGYVIAGRSAARRVADDVLRGRTVGSFVVARARFDGETRGPASLLASPAALQRCAGRVRLMARKQVAS
jgi:hypothetical protein